MKLWQLHDLIAAVCPINGINTNGEIRFQATATEQQKAAAQALMATHLPEIEP